MAGVAVSIGLWLALVQGEQRALQTLLEAKARQFATSIGDELKSLNEGLSRMAERAEPYGDQAEARWQKDARGFNRDFPYLTFVQRVDAGFNVRWRVTRGGQALSLNEAIAPSDALLAGMEAARAEGLTQTSRINRDELGQPFVIVSAPIFIDGQFDGFVTARVALRALVEAVFQRAQLDAAVMVAANGEQIFADPDFGSGPASAPSVSYSAEVNRLSLRVDARPTPALVAATSTAMPYAVLAGALAISAMGAGLTHQRSQLSRANQVLTEQRDKATEREKRFRDLLRGVEMGFVVVDLSGTVVDANEPYARMAGYGTPADVIGHSILEFIAPEKRAAAEQELAGVGSLKVDTLAKTTTTYLQPNGQRIDISIHARIEANRNGAPFMIALCENVTERLRAEQEILESKRIYENIFEATDVAIIDDDMSAMFLRLEELRASGVKDLKSYLDADPRRLLELCRLMRVNNMNREALRMYGAVSLKQIQNMDYFLEGNRPAQVREMACGIWDGLESIRREANYTTFRGEDLSIIYSLRLPRTVEEARRVPVVVLDVTHVRSAEAAKRANVAKSQFLASMSHEIRTPLNGVIGNLELLALTNLSTDQEDLLIDAEKAAKSLLALIGNILDFSKIEAGKLQIENVAFDLSEIIQEAVEIVQSRARQKGIFVNAMVDADMPAQVEGDPTRVRQILLNLIGNAVKFTASGGVHVTATVRDWDNDVCQVLFEVHDSGKGFEPEAAAAFFQPFSQGKRGEAEKIEGTGLGLSICKSLVETFGGEIGCEGQPGAGASFWFNLPFRVIERAKPVPRLDLSGATVLFVNCVDDAAPADVARYLRARNAGIITARDEESAVSRCRKAVSEGRPIDLAIFLIRRDQWPAPGVAGAMRELHTVPVVYGQSTTRDHWRAAMRAGVVTMIPPGFDEDLLDRNLAKFVTGGRLSADAFENGERTSAPDLAVVQGKRILVLEDRMVNQTIIQRQLRKLGATCAIASDGVEGLEKLENDSFDLILCDCSMPEMNGFEFTRILREREKGTGRHVPVVAMTANAFREDMEKCFEAGMDDFLSKPVTLQRLAGVIARCMGGAAHLAIEKPMPRKPAGDVQAIDIAMLQELLGSDDPELLREVLGEFREAARTSWAEVKECADHTDLDAIGRAAHGAKGEARSAGATRLAELYSALELAAKDGDAGAVATALVDIPEELAAVDRQLDAMLKGQAS